MGDSGCCWLIRGWGEECSSGGREVPSPGMHEVGEEEGHSNAMGDRERGVRRPWEMHEVGEEEGHRKATATPGEIERGA